MLYNVTFLLLLLSGPVYVEVKYKRPRLDSDLQSTILLRRVDEEVADTAGVAPLVVVPRDELDEVGVELDSGVGVEDGRVLVADEVGGDNLLVGVADDALVFALSGGLDGGLDVVVGGRLLEADDEIDDGDVEGGDTEGETAGLDKDYDVSGPGQRLREIKNRLTSACR